MPAIGGESSTVAPFEALEDLNPSLFSQATVAKYRKPELTGKSWIIEPLQLTSFLNSTVTDLFFMESSSVIVKVHFLISDSGSLNADHVVANGTLELM